MERSAEVSRRYKFLFFIFALAFLCWGRLLSLKGIWVDDWAWIWQYFATGSLSEFIAPLKSLRHPLDGIIFYANFKLLDIIPDQALHIWNVWKFIIFLANPLLIYLILKGLTDEDSILPEAASALYLVSPIVNNLSTVEFGRRVYVLFFLLSILFSIWSVKKGRVGIPCYLLALSLSVLSICGIESLFFLELVRPAVIFYLLRKNNGSDLLKKIRQAALYWAPFLAAGLFILFFNMGFIKPRSGVYADAYRLYDVSIGKYIVIVVKRFTISVVRLFESNFHIFFKQAVFIKKYLYMFSAAALAALLTAFALFRSDGRSPGRGGSGDSATGARHWTIAGACLTMLGLFPYIVVRGSMVFGIGSRHAILASIGFSIFLASGLLWAYYGGIVKKQVCCGLLAGLIFLGVFNCNAAVRAYSDDWQQQKTFWSQFAKKVPEMKDKTCLIVDMPRYEGLFFGEWRSTFEFSAPLNLIYAKSRERGEVNSHFAQTLKDALDPDAAWAYINNKDKTEGQYESYKGTQFFYPKNLIVASYYNGRLYLNDEIIKAGITSGAGELAANVAPGQIIYEGSGTAHPLRRIMGLEYKRKN